MEATKNENEAEVRREDQDRINQFARLNARKEELRDERTMIQRQLEGLDDAATELMMLNDEDEEEEKKEEMLVLFGEAFCETSQENTMAYCERQVEKLQRVVDQLTTEEDAIISEQEGLKQILYGRFGKSINLESE